MVVIGEEVGRSGEGDGRGGSDRGREGEGRGSCPRFGARAETGGGGRVERQLSGRGDRTQNEVLCKERSAWG